MSKVKLNITRLSITERNAKCQQIISAMTGNPSFPTPNPPLATITSALNDSNNAFNAAQAARQEAKAKTNAQNEADDIVSGVMAQLSAHVESVAGGNEALIRSAGMDTKAAASPATNIPVPPGNLSATAGDRDGEIN